MLPWVQVRFKGHTHWTQLEPNGELLIPAVYVPGWHLEAIEASTAALVYEGFQNLRNLEHLKVLSLMFFPNIDLLVSPVPGPVLLPAHGRVVHGQDHRGVPRHPGVSQHIRLPGDKLEWAGVYLEIEELKNPCYQRHGSHTRPHPHLSDAAGGSS